MLSLEPLPEGHADARLCSGRETIAGTPCLYRHMPSPSFLLSPPSAAERPCSPRQANIGSDITETPLLSDPAVHKFFPRFNPLNGANSIRLKLTFCIGKTGSGAHMTLRGCRLSRAFDKVRGSYEQSFLPLTKQARAKTSPANPYLSDISWDLKWFRTNENPCRARTRR